MDKEGTKEKFGDYLIDISKYVITAVLGALVAILTLIWGLFYFKKKR